MPEVPIAKREAVLQDTPFVTARGVGNIGTPFEKTIETGLRVAGRAEERAAKIADDQTRTLNKAAVLDADYRLSKLKTDLEIQRGQFKGKEAAAALPDLEKAWGDGVKEIEASLANDEQKYSFGERVKHHWLGAGGLYESTLKYTDGEINRYIETNFNANLDLRTNDAVANSEDENRLNQSLLEIKAMVNDHYKDKTVAEKVYNDQKETIEKGIKQLQIEKRQKAKEQEERNRAEANKQLSDFVMADTLRQSASPSFTIGEIKRRRAFLSDTDYQQWVDKYDRMIEKKENAETKPIKDNDSIHRFRTAEMMQITTDAEAQEFKDKIIDDILSGNLRPETGNGLLKNLDSNLSLDTPQKEAMKSVSGFMKNDFENGVYGDPDSEQSQIEYVKQQRALNEWIRAGKDPEEYYEKTKKINGRNWAQNVLNVFIPKQFEVGTELTPEQVRMEAKQEISGKQIVERRRAKDGTMLIKYSDGTIGRE